MNHAAHITTEKTHEYPILIVDKVGYLGEGLARQLSHEFLVVFVSKKEITNEKNVIHISYSQKMPSIPDNAYSYIFLINEREIKKNDLKFFAKKAKKGNSLFILLAELEYANEKVVKDAFVIYSKTRLLILGQIFASNYIYNPHTEINKFIIEAKRYGKISIPGDGTKEISPVFFEDALYEVMEASFTEDDKIKIFYIFPKQTITLLSLARFFRKKDPSIRLDFVKEKSIKQNNLALPKDGQYMLSESYSTGEKIKEVELEKISGDNLPKEIQTTRQRIKQVKFNFSSIFIFLISLVILPILSTLFFLFLGSGFLYLAKSDLETYNFSSSKTTANISKKSLDSAKVSYRILGQELAVFGQSDKIQPLGDIIDSVSEISNASLSMIRAFEKIENVISGKSKNPSSDFSKSLIDIKNAYFIYEKEKQRSLIPMSMSKKLSDIINISSATIDFWPDILGFNNKKTYLILLQNNMELRPGGGFIGSYGLLTVDKGSVQNFKIYDVYDADGQLNKHVEPPYPIRRYLPSVNWYLRESNFNVDFSKGAITSAVFLNTEMRQAVDGIIGVDLSFVRSLLRIVGPVEVTDYKQTVNADNFYEITQANVSQDFFPGSTQKKDFLRSFYNALELKISQSKNVSYLALLEALATSVYEKHVLFAFNNANQQAAFSINGLSSALFDKREKQNNIVNDTAGISEANIGGNKVNYFVTRSMSQIVSIGEDGSVSENLTINIKNNAPTNLGRDGIYKNYLRIILPLGAEISSIIIDDKTQKITSAITDPNVYEKKNFVAPQGLEVEKYNQDKNTIYGFLVTVNPKQIKTIQVEYSLLDKLNFLQPDVVYSLRIFKQPGVDVYPYNLTVAFPDKLKLDNFPGEFNVKGKDAVLETKITRDRKINLSFTQ